MLGQFFLKVVMDYKHHYLVWILTIPAVIITVIHSARKYRNGAARTYIGESMSYLWTGIGISFFVLSVIITSNKTGWVYSYPFFYFIVWTWNICVRKDPEVHTSCYRRDF